MKVVVLYSIIPAIAEEIACSPSNREYAAILSPIFVFYFHRLRASGLHRE
jgi:hypothetical protein